MDRHRTELSFAATIAGFGQAFGELRRALQDTRLEPATRYQVELVFEEIVANILRHGSPSGTTLAVKAALDVEEDKILLSFEDNGVPFDPGRHALPALPNALAVGGGLGLLLVKRAASCLDYRRTPEHTNHLTVTLPVAEARAGEASRATPFGRG